MMTSKIAGRTRGLNFYSVGKPGKLLLVDAPGYGTRGKAHWGELFYEYIENREQLKRIYILFTAEHGLNPCDHEMLSFLSQKLITPRGTQPFTLQAIVTKSDCLPPQTLSTCVSLIQKAIWRTAPLCLPVIVTSTSKEYPLNVDLVQKNIAEACGLELS